MYKLNVEHIADGACAYDPLGYDHTYVLNGERGELRKVAEVYDPLSERKLKVSTTEPAVHLYTGNNLCDFKGKEDALYRQWSGFCLETGAYPDSVGAGGEYAKGACFILRPGGEQYSHKVIYEME